MKFIQFHPFTAILLGLWLLCLIQSCTLSTSKPEQNPQSTLRIVGDYVQFNKSPPIKRAISSSILQRNAQSKIHANQISYYNELSNAFKLGNLGLQSLAGMNLDWLLQNGLSEKGGVVGQNLSADGKTFYTLDTFIGLKARESVNITPSLKSQFELHALSLYNHDFSTLKDSTLGCFVYGAFGLVRTPDRLVQRGAGIIGASS